MRACEGCEGHRYSMREDRDRQSRQETVINICTVRKPQIRVRECKIRVDESR